LTEALQLETGIDEDVVLCMRNPITSKLYKMRLQLPPNRAPLSVVIVRHSSQCKWIDLNSCSCSCSFQFYCLINWHSQLLFQFSCVSESLWGELLQLEEHCHFHDLVDGSCSFHFWGHQSSSPLLCERGWFGRLNSKSLQYKGLYTLRWDFGTQHRSGPDWGNLWLKLRTLAWPKVWNSKGKLLNWS